MARVLDEIASLLELKGENPFKIRAYENAARALDGLTQDLGLLIEAGTLTGVRGIGSPASRASRFARALSPMSSIASGGGPIQVSPASRTALAKPAFSLRNP